MEKLNAFINSDLGRWTLRLVVVIAASAVKAGYLHLPVDVVGSVDVSNVLLGSAALVPSKK